MYTYDNFKEYDEYRKKGEPALPWLPEFEAWLKEYYEVDFLPCKYDKIYQKSYDRVLYNISPMVMTERDARKVLTKTISEFSVESSECEFSVMQAKAIELAQKHKAPILNQNDRIRVFRCYRYLTLYRDFYLLGKKTRDLNKQIESVIEDISHSRIYKFGYYACVFPTKEQAYCFLSNGKYQQLQENIYKLLKPFDEFEVLTKDIIVLLVDYESHYNKIIKLCPYTRWMADNNIEYVKNYNLRILNQQFDENDN